MNSYNCLIQVGTTSIKPSPVVASPAWEFNGRRLDQEAVARRVFSIYFRRLRQIRRRIVTEATTSHTLALINNINKINNIYNISHAAEQVSFT